MFNNLDENRRMLEGSYRKLKGYYFNNKSMLFMRKIIADFEWNDQVVDNTFDKLALLLKYPNSEQNVLYIKNLISSIGYSILPKTFSENNLKKEDIIFDSIDPQKEVSEVNFYIKAPIELLILDTLWSTFLGKIGYSNKSTPKYSYGNVLKYGRLYYKDIDFFSSTMFEFYTNKYTRWKDNAFKEIKKNYRNNKNSLLISLDLKSYFYSSFFNFDSLKSFFGSHTLYDDLKDLTTIIKESYLYYSKLISNYRKNIDGNNCIFPIGFLSSLILSDYYLKPFDELIMQKLKCKYYGRYVDDMLIVLDVDLKESITKTKLIKNLFITTGILFKEKNELGLSIYPNLKIQKKKINLFYISHKKSKNLIDIYNELIRIKPSEENILPDFMINELSFDENAYFLSNVIKDKNLDELKFIKTNNYKAIKFLASITRISKNTLPISVNIINQQCEEIFNYYSGVHAIEYSNAWLWIFDFLIMINKEKNYGNDFYKIIRKQIDSLKIKKLANIDNRKKVKINNIIKKSLQEELLIAISTAVALNIKGNSNEKVQLQARKIRKANMFNDKLCSIPLLNYSNYSDEDYSLLELDVNKIKQTNTLKLETRKLHFSPRFIHLNELFQYYFVRDFEKGGNIFSGRIEKLIDEYSKYNYIDNNLGINEHSLSFENKNKTQIVKFDNYNVKFKYYNKIKIAIVSVPINDEWCINALNENNRNISYENKRRLYKLLQNAYEENVQYIIFPEFYLPFVWLDEVIEFSRKAQIGIICGLQYLKLGLHAYNYLINIQPFTSQYGYKLVLPIIREKNFYPPKEKIGLSDLGFSCEDPLPPNFQIYSIDNIKYSNLMCFELTDIYARSNLKTRINILFAPEYNPDTNYFESIVTSTTRDLHCFMVQVNTSKYGDSRITGPYKTELKNIVQVKGGCNDVLIVGEIDIGGIIDYQERYNQDLLNKINNQRNRHVGIREEPIDFKDLPANFI